MSNSLDQRGNAKWNTTAGIFELLKFKFKRQSCMAGCSILKVTESCSCLNHKFLTCQIGLRWNVGLREWYENSVILYFDIPTESVIA